MGRILKMKLVRYNGDNTIADDSPKTDESSTPVDEVYVKAPEPTSEPIGEET